MAGLAKSGGGTRDRVRATRLEQLSVAPSVTTLPCKDGLAAKRAASVGERSTILPAYIT